MDQTVLTVLVWFVLFHCLVLCVVLHGKKKPNLTVCQLTAVTHHFWIWSGFVISIPASPPVKRFHNTFLFRALKHLAGVIPYKLLWRQVREVKERNNLSKVIQQSRAQIPFPRLMSPGPVCNTKVMSLHSTEMQQVQKENSISSKPLLGLGNCFVC